MSSEVLVMRPSSFTGFNSTTNPEATVYEQQDFQACDCWSYHAYPSQVSWYNTQVIRGTIQQSYNTRIIDSVTIRFTYVQPPGLSDKRVVCQISSGANDFVHSVGASGSSVGRAVATINSNNCNQRLHSDQGPAPCYEGTFTFVFDSPITLNQNTTYYLWLYSDTYTQSSHITIRRTSTDDSYYQYWADGGATLFGETITVPMTVSVSASPYNDNATVNTWGIYLQNYSKANISVSATGTSGAAITNYTVRLGTTQIWSSTSSSGRTATITDSGNITITAVVTDAAGFTATATTTINVRPYAYPNLTNIQCYRCNSSGTAATNGTYLYFSGTPTYSSASGHNSCTTSFKYGVSGGSMGSYTTISNPTTWRRIASGLSTTSTYSVVFKVADTLGNYREFSITIPTELVTMNFKDGGTGVCFGGYANKDNCFEIANQQGWKAVISNGMYGDTLPTSGNTEGQIFFKSIPSGTMDKGVITLASGITSPGWTQYWWRVGNQVTFELMGTNDTGATLSGSDILATGLPIPKFDNSGTRIQSSLIGLIVNSSNGRIGLGFRVAVDNDGTVHMTWAGWIENGDTFSIQGTYFAQ